MDKQTNDIAIILDSEKLFADSFSMLLERYSLFKSFHTFYDVKSFIDFLFNLTLDKVNLQPTVFLDIQQKERNGLSVMADIRRINKKVKVVFLTSSQSFELLNMIKYHKPHGIISKSSGLKHFLLCMQHLREGVPFVCPIISEILKSTPSNGTSSLFTLRELDILIYTSRGYTIDQTAEQLHLSRHTVIAHRRNMLKKTKSSSISQVISIAKNQKLI